MEKTAAAERARSQPEELTAPPVWAEAQPRLAAASGLSVLLVAGPQPPQLTIVNNNSICATFQASPAHAHLCDPYCGAAYQRAQEAGTVSHYRCHAGLHCFAMPVDLGTEQPLAVIGGRAFLASADYRALLDRFRVGDLRMLATPEVFRNVILSARAQLDDLAARVSELAAEVRARDAARTEVAGADVVHNDAELQPAGERQTLAVFPPDAKLRDAAQLTVRTLIESQQLTSVALLLRTEHGFAPLHATGKFREHGLDFELTGVQGSTAGQLHELLAGQTMLAGGAQIELFPLVVHDEVKGALLVGDVPLDAARRTAIAGFAGKIAMPLEVLRLRDELERRMRAAYHLQSFIEQISVVEPGDPYQTILRHCVELLRSERGSLMLFDETANSLQVKAAVGPRAAFAQEAHVRLSDGVAGTAWQDGRR